MSTTYIFSTIFFLAVQGPKEQFFEDIYTYDSDIVLNIVIPPLVSSCKILVTSVNFLVALAARKG